MALPVSSQNISTVASRRPLIMPGRPSWAALGVIALSAVMGCDALVPPMPSDGSSGGNATDGTLDAQLAGALAVQAVESAALAVAVVLPTKDMQRIFEGGLPPPACPRLDVAPSPDEFQMTLDYGTGCSPPPYKPVFRGTADGRYVPAFYAFELSLRDCTIDGNPLTGTISGSAVPAQDVATFLATLDVEHRDGTRVSGTTTVIVDELTGVFRVADGAELSVATAAITGHVTLDGVEIDAATTGNFLPQAGTAAVNVSSAGDDANGSATTIEFTTQTPIDATVQTSKHK